MDVENGRDDNHCQQSVTPAYGDIINAGGSSIEVLERAELEIAFASEKLLNLEMLAMEVARRTSDLETVAFDDASISFETAENAFEFDILYGILDAEVNDLDNLIKSLQSDVKNIEQKIHEEEEPGGKLKAKLDTIMPSLQKMQELIDYIRNEYAKFKKAIPFFYDTEGPIEDVGCENDHLSYQSGTQTEDQRRKVLHMLEQSIANELDLEKKLSDSISVIEDLKLKLHRHEQEACFLEESAETVSGRMFAAENASELLLGTSKELMNRLNTMELHLNSLKCREGDLKVNFEQSLKKQSFLEDNQEKRQEESCKLEAESPSLQDKIQELEKLLRESNSQLQLAKASAEKSQEDQNTLHSEMTTLENVIKNLKDNVSRAESRAQNAEIRCMQLTQSNLELSGELSSLRSHESDKASLLEKNLKESNTQLEHAKASVDAIVEQQSMLKSTMSDMEHMIEDLKSKVLKAETRAGNAESKCTLLTDTNLELSEELSYLRGRVESLENSLREANHVKMSTAKDIGIRTKIITDLVTKLALERERLHLQIATMTKKNKILAQKCRESVKGSTHLSKKAISKDTKQSIEIEEEISPDSMSSQTAGKKPAEHLNTDDGKAHSREEDGVASAEDDSTSEYIIETVRTLNHPLLNRKYVVVAFLGLLVAVLVYLLHQDDSAA